MYKQRTMSAMAIGIFSAVGCIALLALRYVKSNTKQPGRRVGAPALAITAPPAAEPAKH